ncbi:MAG: rRNA maturation RNase YbeY [Atopobiaceae bacterium]|nr:rRNA maturation RNase YbeY [Atopobiaceae bacterium]
MKDTINSHQFDISCDDNAQLILSEKELQLVGNTVLEEEGITRPCLVSISFVSDEHMRQLNRQFRDQDRPTDVLSVECERPNDPDLFEGEPCELGDIVLATAYITRQAQSFGWTPQDECRLLFVHGLLHLLGYDHLEDEEASRMEAREDKLLELVSPHKGKGHVALTRHRSELT